MEEIPSSNESEGDDSDELSKEKEEELYSVLHYNDFSQGVPASLLQKYCISTDKNNEFVISFKNSSKQSKSEAGRSNVLEHTLEQSEGSSLAGGSPVDSSDDDVVVVELDARFVEEGSVNDRAESTQYQDNESVSVTGESTSIMQTNEVDQPALRSPIPRSGSLMDQLGLNHKKRYWENGDPTTYSRKRNSGSAAIEPTTVRNKKRKSTVNAPNLNSETNDVVGSENSKVVLNPNSQASGGGTPTNSTTPLKSDIEVVIEEESNSDDSSCILVEDPEVNRKISISSTESSVVAVLTSEDEVSSFSLNTTGDIAYDSDGNISDVIERSDFDWKEVASPSSWTPEMRKYYNSSCERLRYFDHKKIRDQIKTGSRKDWLISPRDLYPKSRPQPRCLICRQTDHLARNCPKKDPTCHMCGVQGHSNMDCPNSICLQCGKKNRQFTTICRCCSHTLNRECFGCKQTGHESKACPEKWREFHSTTEGSLKKEKRHPAGHQSLQCCNCGKTDHTFEECNQQPMSNFAKSLPAYSWLFGRGSSYEDWRVPKFTSPRSATLQPYSKKRRHRHDRRNSVREGIPQWVPTSKAKHKKKRKKLDVRHRSF